LFVSFKKSKDNKESPGLSTKVRHRGEKAMSISMRMMQRGLMMALIICLFGAMAFAQSTTDGAIGGTIFDGTGAVVGGASITVHNNGTNAEQTITTDNSGSYRVASLQPGSYTVTIKANSGLAPTRRRT
jgi:Carboxypeptidase regulatory-like domain